MMMPANYSVIAENEMTYVVGGGLFDILPDVMTSANWKTVNTNIVKVVGNYFMSGVIGSTLGVMFGGEWGQGKTMFTGTTKDDQGKVTGYTGSITKFYADKDMSVLNKVMGTIGGLASIYTLGTGEVKMSVPTLADAIKALED